MLHYHQTAAFAGVFILKTKREVSAAVFRNSLSSVCLYTLAELQVLERKEIFDGKPLKNKGKAKMSKENKKKNTLGIKAETI